MPSWQNGLLGYFVFYKLCVISMSLGNELNIRFWAMIYGDYVVLVCLELLLWRCVWLIVLVCLERAKLCTVKIKKSCPVGSYWSFVVIVCHPWNDLTFLLAWLPGLSRSLLRAATTRHCEFWYWSHVALRLKQWLVEQSVLRKRKISPSSSQVSIPTEAHSNQPTKQKGQRSGFRSSMDLSWVINVYDAFRRMEVIFSI